VALMVRWGFVRGVTGGPDAARQIEATTFNWVINARSTFSGQPDDATMLAVDRRNAALERRIIKHSLLK
jgi:hypothetical protein